VTSFAAIPALALGDLRDRVRRRSFLAVLAAAAYLGLETIRGNVIVAFGDFTGGATSAWAGTLMAIVANSFLSLAGFWVVKGSIARDRATGVGQILAATPLTRVAYTLSKAVSHFLVLAAMVGVLWVAAVAFQWRAPGAAELDLGAIALPMLLFTLPALAVVAALAVLFETIPLLARGFGNFAWLFVWSALLVLPITTPFFDLLGLRHFQQGVGAVVRELEPAWNGDFRITLAAGSPPPTRTFVWRGFEVGGGLLGERALALAVALALALAAAIPFDRFDPARRRLRAPGPRRSARDRENRESAASGPIRPPSLAPLAPAARDFSLLTLALHELRVALCGMPRWWRLGAAVLLVGGALAPDTARPLWLAAGFLWPALLWSGLGVREREAGVDAILAAAPLARRRQLPALLVAGLLAGLATTGGAIVRALGSGQLAAAAATLAGLAAMPLLALAFGLLARGSRLFEGLFIAAWYVGPLQQTPGFDFAAASTAAVAAGTPYRFALAGATLLAVALAVERRRGLDGDARFG